jgi:hypothetical protein
MQKITTQLRALQFAKHRRLAGAMQHLPKCREASLSFGIVCGNWYVPYALGLLRLRQVAKRRRR